MRKRKKDAAFRTKPKIALQLVLQAVAQKWPFRAVVADSLYGEDRGLRAGLRQVQVPYVLALNPAHAWWHPEGAAGSLREVAHEAGWVSEEQEGALAAHHQDVSRRQDTRLLGGRECGGALWTGEDRTSSGRHHRPSDLA